MLRRSKLIGATPGTPNTAISEIEKKIRAAVKAAQLVDPNTGKEVEGDIISALARIGHDPKVREADRIKALSILLDRTSPAVKSEPAVVAQKQSVHITFQPVEDETGRVIPQQPLSIEYSQSED